MYLHAFDAEHEKGLPFIDVKEDYGKYVLGAIGNGGVQMVLAAPEYVSLDRIVNALTKGAPEQQLLILSLMLLFVSYQSLVAKKLP